MKTIATDIVNETLKKHGLRSATNPTGMVHPGHSDQVAFRAYQEARRAYRTEIRESVRELVKERLGVKT
jgi:hypothetical protein